MKRMNTYDCWDCAKKHLASAIVELGELQRGYWGSDHEIYALGNLNEASEHIHSLMPEAANALRLLRIDIFDKTKKVDAKHIEIAKSIYWKIAKAVPTGQPSVAEIEIPKPENPKEPPTSRTTSLPCCGKAKTSPHS